jgi:hypothetical protein
MAEPVVAAVAAAEPVMAAKPVAAASAPRKVAASPTTEGLVQIETAPDKIAAVDTTPRSQPVNRRRTRQLEVYVENEPLVQIETQHPKV